MISFLLTSWKEEETIGQAIECLCLSTYSGYEGDFELLLVAPDEETRVAAEKKVDELGIRDKYKYFKDESIGKPAALNILFKEAKGDIWILTDGEVYFAENAVKDLINKLDSDPRLGIVSGNPQSLNDNKTFWGYLSHMNTAAVNHMRLTSEALERLFPISGYCFAMLKTDIQLPTDLFLDDAYITYTINNMGYRVGYSKDAKVFVKYPTNWEDFKKQKMRSALGFEQLWKYGIIKENNKSRNFRYELSYFWFPIRFASNIMELLWSLAYYPIRLYFWILNRLKRDIAYKAKSIRDVYVRTESTK